MPHMQHLLERNINWFQLKTSYLAGLAGTVSALHVRAKFHNSCGERFSRFMCNLVKIPKSKAMKWTVCHFKAQLMSVLT